MSDELAIRTFQDAIKEAVADSNTPTLPIKFKGRTFKPPKDQQYVEIVFIPNNPDGLFWGSEKLYQGIFRLILHWPNDDKGIYEPLNVIESVSSYFTKQRKLLYFTTSTWDNGQLWDNDQAWLNDVGFDVFALNIYEEPKLLSDIEAGKETLYPVSMAYRSFRP